MSRTTTTRFTLEPEQSYTPTPVMVDPRPVDTGTRVSFPGFLTLLSVLLGILIGTGTLIGVVGKAFYVERGEYNAAVVKAAEDKTKSDQIFEQLRTTLSRQETVLQKLTDDVSGIKQDVAVIMRGRR